LNNPLYFVENGAELLDYLERRARYRDSVYAMPGLFLLDLHMPRVDGHEALSGIKSDPALQHIPVIVRTTSSADEDIARSYHAGFNRFIQKLGNFPAFV